MTNGTGTLVTIATGMIYIQDKDQNHLQMKDIIVMMS